MKEPSEEPEDQSSPSISPEIPDMYSEFKNWRSQPSAGKIKIKPKAIGKLWKEIKKEYMPFENEEEWLNKLSNAIGKLWKEIKKEYMPFENEEE